MNKHKRESEIPMNLYISLEDLQTIIRNSFDLLYTEMKSNNKYAYGEDGCPVICGKEEFEKWFKNGSINCFG